MILVNDRTVDLNALEQAAAVQINFPFQQFKTRKVGKDKTYMRVEFKSKAQCELWKRCIFGAMHPQATKSQLNSSMP